MLYKEKNKKQADKFWSSKFGGLSHSLLLCDVRIEMKSNREAVLEGCKSIEEYDENMVKIKFKKMHVAFFGRNLEIKCLTADSLVIKGFITSVEFIT